MCGATSFIWDSEFSFFHHPTRPQQQHSLCWFGSAYHMFCPTLQWDGRFLWFKLLSLGFLDLLMQKLRITLMMRSDSKRVPKQGFGKHMLLDLASSKAEIVRRILRVFICGPFQCCNCRGHGMLGQQPRILLNSLVPHVSQFQLLEFWLVLLIDPGLLHLVITSSVMTKQAHAKQFDCYNKKHLGLQKAWSKVEWCNDWTAAVVVTPAAPKRVVLSDGTRTIFHLGCAT